MFRLVFSSAKGGWKVKIFEVKWKCGRKSRFSLTKHVKVFNTSPIQATPKLCENKKLWPSIRKPVENQQISAYLRLKGHNFLFSQHSSVTCKGRKGLVCNLMWRILAAQTLLWYMYVGYLLCSFTKQSIIQLVGRNM